jgi:hypothetical protein
MKKIVKSLFVIVVILIVFYLVAWFAASTGLIKDVEFGYYGEFNVAKHAIERTGCTERIEYNRVNMDIALEEMTFKVTTKSGRVVLLWFDGSNMDVSQVCYQPVGISVCHPAHEHELCERWSIAGLSEHLKEKGFQVKNLRDILCNIDELEEVFRMNNGDANALREADPYVWDYLRIEFPTEEDLKNGGKYTDVKDKDISDWP